MSQTIPRGGPRSQIAIPAQGMIEFRDALTELLDEFGTDDQGQSLGLMQVVVIHYASFDCLATRFNKKKKKKKKKLRGLCINVLRNDALAVNDTGIMNVCSVSTTA